MRWMAWVNCLFLMIASEIEAESVRASLLSEFWQNYSPGNILTDNICTRGIINQALKGQDIHLSLVGTSNNCHLPGE